MLRTELDERVWQLATAALSPEKTFESAIPTGGTISGARSSPSSPLGALAPGELITVRTRNSLYRLIVLDPIGQKILVQGGRHFPCSTEACLLDGSRVPELLAGTPDSELRLQLVVVDRCFVTSPIVAIDREGSNIRVSETSV